MKIVLLQYLTQQSNKPRILILIRTGFSCKKRRETESLNIASSGIEESNTEADELLDDIIVQVLDMDEKRKAQAEELRELNLIVYFYTLCRCLSFDMYVYI